MCNYLSSVIILTRSFKNAAKATDWPLTIWNVGRRVCPAPHPGLLALGRNNGAQLCCVVGLGARLLRNNHARNIVANACAL